MAAFQEGTVISAKSITDDTPFSVTVTSSEAVARGGTASVFVGRTSEPVPDDEPLALKVFTNVLTVNDVTRGVHEQLLRRELRAARGVKHEHILTFTGVAFHAFHTILISPYMKNGDLMRYINDNPAVNRNILVLQIAEAVDHLHRVHRMVHGDLKCENVLVSNDGAALLADFGLSTFSDKVDGQTKTTTGVRLRYTVQFAAPELLAADDVEGPNGLPPKTCETDVYAFGMTVLQVFTGRPPWPGLGFQAIVQNVCSVYRHKEYPHPGRQAVDLGLIDPWWKICIQCWSTEPYLRPTMARAFSHLSTTYQPVLIAGNYLASIDHDSAPRLGNELESCATMLKAIMSLESGEQWLLDNKSMLYARMMQHLQEHRQNSDPLCVLRMLDDLRLLEDTFNYGSLEIAESIQPLWTVLGATPPALSPHRVECTTRTFSPGQQWRRRRLNISRINAYSAFPIALIGHSDAVMSLQFLPGDRLVSMTRSGAIRIWDIKTGESLEEHQIGHRVVCADFLPKSNSERSLVACACGYDNRASTFDVVRSADGFSMTVHTPSDDMSTVCAIAFLPSGSHIASGSANGTLRVWHIFLGTQVAKARHSRRKRGIFAVAVSPCSSLIASGSDDGTLQIWQWEDSGAGVLRRRRGPFSGHASRVSSLSFSPDSKSIASGSHDGTFRIWDVSSGITLLILSPPLAFPPPTTHGIIMKVVFAPSGKHIVSVTGTRESDLWDNTVRIWDAVTGDVFAVLKGHTAAVSDVSISANGAFIASGSCDGTVRVWDRAPSSETQTVSSSQQSAYVSSPGVGVPGIRARWQKFASSVFGSSA